MKSNLIDEVAKNQKVYRQFQKIEDKQFLLSITGHYCPLKMDKVKN